MTAIGEYTLQGFAGSAVNSLTVRVNDYTALLDLVRDQYDVLYILSLCFSLFYISYLS